jgi:signal transduction histidine kinase
MGDPAANQERGERLRRLAAVGLLTRVFAHDLNNILGSLLGTAHLMSLRSADPALLARLDAISDATNRAIALARAFGDLAGHGLAAGPLDLHDLLRQLALTAATLGHPPATPITIETAAHRAFVQGDRGSLLDAFAVFASAIARCADFAGTVRIATSNRGRISAPDGDPGGDSWLRVALHGQGRPLGEALRRVIDNPLAAAPDDRDGIILAGAVAAVGRSHGLVQVPERDHAALWVHLPTIDPGAR